MTAVTLADPPADPAAPVRARQTSVPSPRVRVALVVLLVVVAYQHSLRALARFLTTDTPLAYLGLVPLLVLGVALVQGRAAAGEARLPHRQVDWIVGVPLLAVAAFVAVALPERLSYEFWTYRLDMLGLPFFAAGLTSLLLGVRVLRRVRLPLAALLLAWPLPWQLGLDRVLDATTWIAVSSVGLLAPLAGGVQTAGTSLFIIGSGSMAFDVNVAPQCAGANSALGFLLVGCAAVSVSRGPLVRKALWLLVGTALVLALNVARILTVFAVGARLGERAAIDWLHPYIGLVLFTGAIVLLVRLLPRFGLVLLSRGRGAVSADEPVHAPRRIRPALIAVTALAVALGVNNAALARFDPFLGLDGGSTYAAAADSGTPVPGWSARATGSIDWATPYFGQDSTWDRFTAVPVAGGSPVFLDVVGTSDLESFSQYGLQACYRFHDYRILSTGRLDVGGPAVGETISYVEKSSGRTWSVVSWVLPVRSSQGTRFERTAAFLSSDSEPAARAAATATLTDYAKLLVERARPT